MSEVRFYPRSLDRRRIGAQRNGDPTRCHSHGVPKRQNTIQLPYINSFASIWEYDHAFRSGAIDFSAAIGQRCPLCGQPSCYRAITPYSRGVTELFPFRDARVLIARFQCRSLLQTFSLLPHQLAPYSRYTIRSKVLALLLAHQIHQDAGSGVYAAPQELPHDCLVTPYLLLVWLSEVVRALRRAHPELRAGVDLSQVRSGADLKSQLVEVSTYVWAFSPRGPPGARAVDRMLRHYALRTRMFFLGAASQDRYPSVQRRL